MCAQVRYSVITGRNVEPIVVFQVRISSCIIFFVCLKVRDSPQYHLIKACVHKNLGNHEECVKTLNTAMALPGVKKASKALRSSLWNYTFLFWKAFISVSIFLKV